jgi:hypothetical protein
MTGADAAKVRSCRRYRAAALVVAPRPESRRTLDRRNHRGIRAGKIESFEHSAFQAGRRQTRLSRRVAAITLAVIPAPVNS